MFGSYLMEYLLILILRFGDNIFYLRFLIFLGFWKVLRFWLLCLCCLIGKIVFV